MLSLSLVSTKLSLCCNFFCFGVRSRCIFVSLRNFWTTSISFTFFLSILFDNTTSASYTEFFLFDIFQLSFSHHTLCSSFEDSPWQAWLLCTRQKDIWIGVTASAPPPLSHVLRMDPMPSIDVDFCLTQTMKMSQISNTCETHNHVKRPYLWSFFSGNLPISQTPTRQFLSFIHLTSTKTWNSNSF